MMIVTRIRPHFGADVEVDIKQLGPAHRNELVQLLGEHKVLRFRQQFLSPEQFITFSELFGECWGAGDDGLQGNNEQGRCLEGYPKITLVSNQAKGVLRDHDIIWHNDVSHRPWEREGGTCPTRILYAVTLPKSDPCPTHWLDQEWLYDHCPLDIRDDLEERMATYKAPYTTAWEHCRKRIVQINPITGRKTLMVDRLFLKGIDGYSNEKFVNTRNRLLQLAQHPDNVITNHWEVGDLVINNNYNTAHWRPSFKSQEERTLWRSTFQVPEIIPKTFV